MIEWTARLLHGGLTIMALSCVACEPVRTPPPRIVFDGLPVSGTLTDAQRAGFDDCFNMDAVHLRCRRHALMVEHSGPYEAAVDLEGGSGEGGFDQMILWHPTDNYAVYAYAEAFERAGWQSCSTGDDHWGDQIIYSRKGAPVRVSMDISYYAKRRLRLIPAWNVRERQCSPNKSPDGNRHL